MRLDTVLTNQLRIPTTGMKKYDVIYRQFSGLLTEIKSTTFYKDNGRLNWSGDESELTCSVYFIQREDGVVKVVSSGLMGVNAYHILKDHLEADIKADVIECKIPDALIRKCIHSDFGALAYIALRHPDWRVRKDLATQLLEYEDAQTNPSQSA